MRSTCSRLTGFFVFSAYSSPSQSSTLGLVQDLPGIAIRQQPMSTLASCGSRGVGNSRSLVGFSNSFQSDVSMFMWHVDFRLKTLYITMSSTCKPRCVATWSRSTPPPSSGHPSSSRNDAQLAPETDPIYFNIYIYKYHRARGLRDLHTTSNYIFKFSSPISTLT